MNSTTRTRNIGRTVAAGAAALALAGTSLLMSAGSASAANGTYPTYVINNTSGMCLDVGGGSGANGASVIQWACNGGNNQKWLLRDGQLVNAASGKCLDIPGGQGAGARLVQWACNGGGNQHWRAMGDNYGETYVNDATGGLVLEIPGATTSAGAHASVWYYNGGQHQIWH
ncbi:RICIN domain-containing protein [Streptomyces sp. NPDC093111]|uniref:RICIN domain-containing protein n=1 Tax=Streptomyces sp. NPDC093111 TaxID=3154978 RepID=UPI00343EF171